MEDLDQRLKEVATVAQKALCLRAKCGTIIVKDGEVVSEGYNAPPQDDERYARCLKKSELKPGFKSDSTCCMHAEQRAIMSALSNCPDKLPGSRLYFIRLSADGLPEPAGKPYCTHCSKLALDSGVAEFVLWHKDGPKVYPTGEYNDLSYKYDGE